MENLKKSFLILFLVVTSCLSSDLKITIPEIDMNKQVEFAEKMYQGDDYMSKEDFQTVKEVINEAKAVIEDGPFDFVLYFSSASVPSKSLFNVLHEIGILQDNGVRLDSKIYLVGPPDDFKEYMFKVENELAEFSTMSEVQDKVRRNFNLKMDPRFFELFDLKKVPAMVLAKCESLIPRPNQCEYTYLIKGDVSLTTFFNEISLKNKKFEKYVNILQGNKIVELGGK